MIRGMLELLISNGEALGVPAITIAGFALILKMVKDLRAENTEQHETGRQERVASEARLGGKIDKVDTKVESLGTLVGQNREDIAYLRGLQDAS